MIDDNEPLWAAIEDIAMEADGANEIAPDVIDKLIECGLVRVVKGRPVLTAYGEKAYVVLESGDGYIPDLDGQVTYGR